MANFQTKRYFTTLDGLRGIAALIVVLSHLGETFDLPRCVAHAHLAVEFFFLLSGFILAYAYDNRWTNMSIWSFFRRRLVRLHPLVPLCVLLGIVPLVLISPDGLPGGSPLNFALLAVGCALMIPAFPIQSMNPFNGPVWTLFYEYLANILYALVLRRLGKKALLALIAVAAAETTVVALRIDLFGLLLRYGYTFKAGWCFKPAHFYVATTRLAFPLLAGLLICRAGLRIRVRHAFWPCAAAFAAILLVPVLGGENLWRGGLVNGIYELVAVLAVLPCLLMLGAGDASDGVGVTAKVARFLGEISFPLYMTHYPFRMLLGWLCKGRTANWTNVDFALAILAFFAVTIAFAWLAKRFYNDPVYRMLARPRGNRKVTK